MMSVGIVPSIMASVRARLYGSLHSSPGVKCWTTMQIFTLSSFGSHDGMQLRYLMDFIWKLFFMLPQE